jgi:hypothetical protein
LAHHEKPLYLLLWGVISAFAAAGFIEQGFESTLRGFLILQSHPARLINDFTSIGGVGGALVNSAAVGAVGLVIVKFSKVRLSGPTIAAIFTLMGFGLFGKTPLNILPIIIGVYLAAKIVGKPFNVYILMALFGTALGPLVTYMVFEAGFTGYPAVLVGSAAGVLTGICLPPIAISMLHLHQGFNLYNLGLSCGFFGLFAAAFLSASKRGLDIKVIWNKEASPVLIALIPLMSVLFIIYGFILGGKKTVKDLAAIQKIPGRLPSDFLDMVSPAGALVNVGLLGLAGSAYVYFIEGDFNGPVLGGLLTLMGFGAFGKHLKNSWPIVAGVVLSCFVFGKDLTAPGPILAALFGTTLAPLAGQFGVLTGVAAGFIHLVMVERSAAWHGGMDLYNNGFAGGLTATLFVAVIEWYRSNKLDK